MNCEEVTELLPWFLNDTLEMAEEELMHEHLEGCGRCRQELDESVLVRSIYRRAPNEAVVRAPAIARKRWWELAARPRLAWAACFVALIALGGWFWSWRQARTGQANVTEQQRAMRERVASLESEKQNWQQTESQLRQQLEGANQQIAQLQEQAKDLISPQLNTPVRDVHPNQPLQRKSGDQAEEVNDLDIPPGAKLVTLILNSQNPDVYRGYSLEMLDARNAVRWSAGGLARNPSSDYTISLPAEFLAPGASYTINIYGEGKGRRVKVESYRIRVRRARR